METFTCTSDAPYDQCYYAIIMKDGKAGSVWDDYCKARDHWMIYRGRGMKSIEVLTFDEVRRKAGIKPKGFQ